MRDRGSLRSKKLSSLTTSMVSSPIFLPIIRDGTDGENSFTIMSTMAETEPCRGVDEYTLDDWAGVVNSWAPMILGDGSGARSSSSRLSGIASKLWQSSEKQESEWWLWDCDATDEQSPNAESAWDWSSMGSSESKNLRNICGIGIDMRGSKLTSSTSL